MPIYVLDSYAILALLQKEPGNQRVRELLEEAQDESCQVHISLINLGELAYIIERRWGVERSHEALAYLRNTALQWAAVTENRVWTASRLKAAHPIAFADAFAAGLALELGGTLVTGDPEFRQLEAKIAIEWLPFRTKSAP